jgi:hypothetical protein
MNLKTDLIMGCVDNFYNEPEIGIKRICIIKSILEGKHKLSLRILDWFVTNYSKKHILLLNNERVNNIYQIYKSKLKGSSKVYFDPFNRKNKIEYYYTKTEFISTTPAQLCFFKWCFEYNILYYVEKHYDIIEKDMKENTKEKSKPKISVVDKHIIIDFN